MQVALSYYANAMTRIDFKSHWPRRDIGVRDGKGRTDFLRGSHFSTGMPRKVKATLVFYFFRRRANEYSFGMPRISK